MHAAGLEVSTVLHEGFGMSMDLMVQAMKIKVGNPLRKLVLLKLADNASDLGECWPSYQHIADQCEISKRSVMNHIEALCECGLIKKELRTGPKGIPATCISSIYVVQEIHQGECKSFTTWCNRFTTWCRIHQG